ncbi:hypothetical protein HY639_02275 [Candidatus Woesearchaeota archaeon]|nr:hypothetical protein [Candidatus Woesearchaeota archaeon]
MAKGVWSRGKIFLLENGELRKDKQYRLFSESKGERMNKRFDWNDGEIVSFDPALVEGVDVAKNVQRTGDPPYRKKR